MGQADPVLRAPQLLSSWPSSHSSEDLLPFCRGQTEAQGRCAVCPELHLGEAHLGFELSLPDPEATFVTKGPCGLFFTALKD